MSAHAEIRYTVLAPPRYTMPDAVVLLNGEFVNGNVKIQEKGDKKMKVNGGEEMPKKGGLLSVLLEKSVINLLLLLHILLTHLQPIALTLNVNHGTMVEYPVLYSRSNGDVGKDLIQLGKGFVRGKQPTKNKQPP